MRFFVWLDSTSVSVRALVYALTCTAMILAVTFMASALFGILWATLIFVAAMILEFTSMMTTYIQARHDAEGEYDDTYGD